MSLYARIAEEKLMAMLGRTIRGRRIIRGQEGKIIAEGFGKCINVVESNGDMYVECVINGKQIEMPDCDWFSVDFQPTAKVKVSGSAELISGDAYYKIEAEGHVIISIPEEGGLEVMVK